MEWLWPVLEDADSAREATRLAAIWAVILAVLSLGICVLAPPTLLGGFICTVYGVAAWRIWKGSRAWAVAAFVLCVTQGILVLLSLPIIWGLIMPFAFVALMNGVRATATMQKIADNQ
jgi:hypothetical protein